MLLEKAIQTIVQKIETQLQENVTVQKTINRRGTCVLKLDTATKSFFLKIIDLNTGPPYSFDERKLLFNREIAILQHLTKSNQFTFVDKGSEGPFTWLLTDWIEGVSLMSYIKKINETHAIAAFKEKMISLFIKLTERVQALHQLGIFHQDLQPNHFIINESQGISIVDFGVSQYINKKGELYKGALIHFVSPEVAEGMLHQNSYINYELTSEIYALGATLFTCYTPSVPINYGTKAYKAIPMDVKLKCIIENNLHCFSEIDAIAFPKLETILHKCLHKEQAKRYQNMEELLQDLKKLQ